MGMTPLQKIVPDSGVELKNFEKSCTIGVRYENLEIAGLRICDFV